MNEDIYDCARRETLEEAGIEIENLSLIGVTNEITPDRGTHFITLHIAADWRSGEARLTEPESFEVWEWFAWDDLPKPLFLATQNFVDTGLNPFTTKPFG